MPSVPHHPDALTELRAIVHCLRAPGGCPWDQEQTHQSLIPNLLEEAYEVADAIRSGDTEHLCEELGDLLLQSVLHSEIASETGTFDLDRVARKLSEKLIRRHPHVFADATAGDTQAVLQQWDEIKRAEKGTQSEGYLHGVGNGLPALMRAQKLQKKAARIGFDWPDLKPVIAKIHEEILEVEQAIASQSQPAIEDEIGDLLFAVVNLARHNGIQAEAALAAANNKFTRRFHKMEDTLQQSGSSLEQADLQQMDDVWNAIKHSV